MTGTRGGVDPSTIVRRSPRAEFRALADDGGVVLNLDTADYHGINAVGALVWQLADGIEFGELLRAVREQIVGAPPTFDDEIASFVLGMEERSLLLLDRADAHPN